MTKTTWTLNDNYIVSDSYRKGIPYKNILVNLSHLKPNSIKMKYMNCLYLDRGNVKGSLSNVSKNHRKIWNMLIAK